MDRIYLDNAATTRMDERVLEAMLPYMTEAYGNAGGKYSLGYEARRAVNEARKKAAALIGAEPDEIFFTSGGTESNNTVINGFLNCDDPGIVVSTEVEHDSVLEPIKRASKKNVKTHLLKTDIIGHINPADLRDLLKNAPGPDEKKNLVSVMMVNNELGTEQPIEELARITHEYGSFFHTDAVQAAGHIAIDVKKTNVDFLSVSGHKLYGPKGTGFLFVKRGIPHTPLLFGGGQEMGMRSGTENVAGIAGLGKACELALKENEKNSVLESELGKYLKSRLQKNIQDTFINGESDRIINISFKGINGTSLVLRLDMEGICVSTGSACSSGLDKRSHVLEAIGLSPERCDSSIRISLGKYNTKKEIEHTCECIEKLVAELRLLSQM
jgi:cysteine desulfurase